MKPLGQRLAAGDSAAFEELYSLCADRCHHYLVVYLRSRDAADEVLQEVFVRLVRQRRSLQRVENLLAFVFTVARHEAIRYMERRARDRQRREKLLAEDLFLEARCNDVVRREAAENVAEALRQLSDEAREVVELKIYGALTFREIAELLAVPQGTVATRYRSALARLKYWFARQPS